MPHKFTLIDEKTGKAVAELAAMESYEAESAEMQADYLDADSWMSKTSVLPIPAALLLFGQRVERPPYTKEVVHARRTRHCDLAPPMDGNDFEALLNAFEKAEHSQPASRGLRAWAHLARSQGLRYHPWVDAHLEASGESATPLGQVLIEKKKPADGVSLPDRGRHLKRMVLIAENLRRWQDIERDLKDGATNGLSAAARDQQKHGWWWEGDALTWARARGKIQDHGAALNSLPTLVHRISD